MSPELSKKLDLFMGQKRVLITGGAGFIGSAIIRRLLINSNCIVFNLDKLGYSSDLTSIDEILRSRKDINPTRSFKEDDQDDGKSSSALDSLGLKPKPAI